MLLPAVIGILVSSVSSLPPPCESDIYCHGELLHTVQMNSPFNDSKTFVDMKMKYNRTATLERFSEMMSKANNNPSKDDIRKFVNETFDPPGSEFEEYKPQDWKEEPTFLKKIADTSLRKWAGQLNSFWKLLGRKIKADVKENPGQYSIIYVPNPAIVPGGRFREFYYWDSYWVIRGLLLSEMYQTVKGMLENFLSMVNRFGKVPNGGRIYYEGRSQPPLLIPMVKLYKDATGDDEFLKQNMHTLEKEFLFWTSKHAVKIEKNGKSYTLARYEEFSSGPRPESYKEDVRSAENLNEPEKQNLYSELKSAAESGWDFSSRWFILKGENKGNLKNTKTRSIIPVDLNAIIYMNAKLLEEFYDNLKMEDERESYKKIAEDWLEAVTNVLWDDKVGIWLDYDIQNKKKRNYFYGSNFAPLWTNCYDLGKKEYFVKKVLNYVENTKVTDFPGGVPTSMEETGEQWDFPNAWPPLQHILITGLDTTGDERARQLAFRLAQKWITANYKGFSKNDAMFEKYDVAVAGKYGGGGEYQIQLGFGWTNGVVLDLLNKYGDRLGNSANQGRSASWIFSQVLVLTVIFAPFDVFIGTII